MRTVFIGAGLVSIETARMLGNKGMKSLLSTPTRPGSMNCPKRWIAASCRVTAATPTSWARSIPLPPTFYFVFPTATRRTSSPGLVGRSLGFKRVVTSIGDPQFESICHELGLEDTIIPSRTISRYLVDMVGGSENVELSTIIKDEARFFILIAGKDDAVAAKDLHLPAEAKVICYYRDGRFSHADEETTFQEGDEVVVLTHSKNMSVLQERWKQKPIQEEPEDPSQGKERDPEGKL